MHVNIVLRVSTFLLVAVGTLVPAYAAPITYTVQTIGTGRLGGSSFSDALVTVTFTGDTDDVQVVGPVFVSFVSRAPERSACRG